MEAPNIDYNKENCRMDNLVALCHSCNAKVNRNREHWEEFFKIRLKESVI